jgi:hypothetical protein
MKKKIKDLTLLEKHNFCTKNLYCENCPLYLNKLWLKVCLYDLQFMQKEIKKRLNQEIEVNEDE